MGDKYRAGDFTGVTPCKVSSAPPGRGAMAKGTTYIWPKTRQCLLCAPPSGKSAYQLESREPSLSYVYGAASVLLSRKHSFSGHVE